MREARLGINTVYCVFIVSVFSERVSMKTLMGGDLDEKLGGTASGRWRWGTIEI